jgi:hypothetical protein
MKDFKYIWLVGLLITILIVVVPIISVVSTNPAVETADPWANVPVRAPHVDHTALMTGPY